MAFVKVAEISEITEGNKMKVLVSDNEILLANVGGTYYAITDKCPHMGGSLSDGTLQGSTIVCPKHGAKIDVTTGKATEDLKFLFLKLKLKDALTYAVKVDDKDILIDI